MTPGQINTRALIEGWGLFKHEGSVIHPWRLDEIGPRPGYKPRFQSGLAVWVMVAKQADEGVVLAYETLRWLHANEPAEFRAIAMMTGHDYETWNPWPAEDETIAA
jgi:hypothetical protein